MKIDAETVKLARGGDEQSFANLYDLAAPQLYKIALFTLGNAHDAEDVVAETFLEAYKGIHNLRDETAFKPWITRILSIRCKRKISEYIQNRNIQDIDDYLHLTKDEGDLSQATSGKMVIAGALGQLSYEERSIVILSVLGGYTVKEIAKIMGSPQGTVSSKLYRALKKMRTQIEKDEEAGR